MSSEIPDAPLGSINKLKFHKWIAENIGHNKETADEVLRRFEYKDDNYFNGKPHPLYDFPIEIQYTSLTKWAEYKDVKIDDGMKNGGAKRRAKKSRKQKRRVRKSRKNRRR